MLLEAGTLHRLQESGLIGIAKGAPGVCRLSTSRAFELTMTNLGVPVLALKPADTVLDIVSGFRSTHKVLRTSSQESKTYLLHHIKFVRPQAPTGSETLGVATKPKPLATTTKEIDCNCLICAAIDT